MCVYIALSDEAIPKMLFGEAFCLLTGPEGCSHGQLELWVHQRGTHPYLSLLFLVSAGEPFR